ncbi:CtsR family transcriptional regulator [Fervidicella metallireducens AeB]|uniref:Transcriptional regulator CtsR n=1 Tax=Fervidicella metallireducens AeB TaxID=1403537 RepID=A0A017RVX6_9CLOT|nr:CtsR family transcriptional regulator [Fervidicella metallireducens]EYE88933.1 CtsR family transcriptional regulator [Fervidicella metallireducens AeB]
MARLSDIIENFIKQLIEEADRDVLEIQRNELANMFNCAPSQINYVLTTRFNIDKGYYIESKRGGGGCIKITKIKMDENDYFKQVIWNNIGNEITQSEAEGYIKIFYERGLINEREAKMMKAALNDKTLMLPGSMRDVLRAQILKTMLISVLD